MSRALSNRWRDESGQRLAAQVLDRLVAGAPLDTLPLERHEGRVDLRGFAIPDPEVLGEGYVAEEGGEARAGLRWLGGLVELRGGTVTDVDFTGARLEHLRFFDTTLRNCRFDHAKCRDWRGWSLTVDGCSFVGTDLRDAALGTWFEDRGNRWHAVTFDAADLRGVTCRRASFIGCEFTATRLDKVEFEGCEFVRSRFVGLLDEVRFLAEGIEDRTPSRLEDVDFSAATLRWVDFADASLDKLVPPVENDQQVVVRKYPCVVRGLVSRLSDDDSIETRTLRSRILTEADRLDSARDVGVFHVDELGDTPDRQRAARDLLHEVERECIDKS